MNNAKDALQGYVCPKCGHMEFTPLMDDKTRQTVIDLLTYAIQDTFYSGSQHGLELGKAILNSSTNEPIDKEKMARDGQALIQKQLDKFINGIK